jgi:hypothetical protein
MDGRPGEASARNALGSLVALSGGATQLATSKYMGFCKILSCTFLCGGPFRLHATTTKEKRVYRPRCNAHGNFCQVEETDFLTFPSCILIFEAMETEVPAL